MLYIELQGVFCCQEKHLTDAFRCVILISVDDLLAFISDFRGVYMSGSIKDLKFSILLDTYGALLSEKHREILDCYYNNDYSLSEISENTGITRQGVSDALRRAGKQLEEMEEKLGFIKITNLLKQEAELVQSGKSADVLLLMIENL